jgi:hypothetical protein
VRQLVEESLIRKKEFTFYWKTRQRINRRRMTRTATLHFKEEAIIVTAYVNKKYICFCILARTFNNNTTNSVKL